MKLVVLGANGRTGRLVVKKALARGQSVTAVVRADAGRIRMTHPDLHVAVGDPCDPQFLSTVFQGRDAVISTLGGRRPTRRATSVYWRSADAIVAAARNAGVSKVAVTSSALLFPPQTFVDRLLTWAVPRVVQSAMDMEQRLIAAECDVIVARCGFLTDRREAQYRAADGVLPDEGASVSRLGLATFLVDAIREPFVGHRVYGVSGPARSA